MMQAQGRFWRSVSALLVVSASSGFAQTAVVGAPGVEPTSASSTGIESFDALAGWEKQGAAQLETASAAAVGSGAITFSFPGSAFKKTKEVSPRVPEALDEGYEGVSFWVKGDGSDLYGTITLCGNHPLWMPFKYATSFPLKDTEWKQYVVPWRDWIPEDDVYPVGTPGGAPPSNLQHVKVGSKWSITHNNRSIPRHSYSVDQIQLEAKVPAVETTPTLQSLDVVRTRFAAKQPVQILCLGDSITAGTSLAKADEERYAQVLERMLRQRLGYDSITVQSRAVGGAQGNDLRLWVGRDFEGLTPDVTIVMYGYNDKTWGYPKAYCAYGLADLLERVARQTEGRTAALLLTPTPGRGARFLMMDDYAEAVRDVAANRKVALCDAHKTFKAFGRSGVDAYFADQAHPNAKGHELLATLIADVLVP